MKKNGTFKEIKILQVIGQPWQDIREILLIQFQVMWNVCDFIGDIIRQLIGTELWCGGAPEQKRTLVPGVQLCLLQRTTIGVYPSKTDASPHIFFPIV